MYDVQVFWSMPEDPGGNTAHVAEHGLTPEEVEDVLLDPDVRIRRSRTTKHRTKFGWTVTGKYIMVSYVEEAGEPKIVIPVTAYEVPPPAKEYDR